jgi:hypothetical protein
MLSSLIAVALAAIAPMRVEISTPKPSVWVYEPVKLTVRATAIRPVPVPPVLDSSGLPMTEVWIDYGSGFVLYTDDSREQVEDAGDRHLFAPGQTLVFTVVLIEGQRGTSAAVPFAEPGRRALKVRLRYVDGMLGESAPIQFEVSRPDEDGERLLSQVADNPFLLRAHAGVYDTRMFGFLQEFPDSPYLHWGRYRIAHDRRTRIGNGDHPYTGESFAEVGQGSEQAKGLSRELANDLLKDRSWGPFDEERLALVASNLERAEADEDARAIWLQIAERFPGSAAAEQAKSRIDSTPPTVAVVLSPSSVWPPNQKLVPITASIQVSDEADPSPRVKLESIVCDDGCAPPRDIAGAALGTDDREFAVRAERRGTGAGRTYKVTYSAEDAAGNRTVVEATVVVAHDKGKKPDAR